MAQVQLKQLRKDFAGVPVVHGIDLDIAHGEFVVLVGPSGCGKSTLLRMIAGLEPISGGELRIGGARANDLSPQKRNISMVFQSYALYPHLSVYENIAFGPRTRGEAESDFRPRIEKAASLLNLTPYLDRLPRALSGGQRQRVAMGRAVVREPALFLFDEPLSNLDAQLRVQMRAEIKALHQRLGNTMVYVTHDQVEAMTMADRIVVMRAGRVEQVGAPLELYDRPVNRFVAGFIGSPAMNFTQGQVHRAHGRTWLALPDGQAWDLPTSGCTPLLADGQHVLLGLRPEHLQLAPEGLALRVILTESTGDKTQIYGTVAGSETPWCVSVHDRVALKPGDLVHLQVREAASTHCFDAQTERHVGVAAPAPAGYRPSTSSVDARAGGSEGQRHAASIAYSYG
ncbi:ABC transporter ATP-binding protein [Variovorax boronicumulans]|uniref:ABC transporter ATP-binding protein n=1 Tax=Variovorax boronicumulans TaxID=436515 RepID=UPI0012E490DB|nr:sn-glycerol-3-phosphate ABC transporter ATP-binding protein UgpC [Variovorax boronicumulans]GER17814.1 sn-glycerol-3-phosphate ABC transporter ATP-binding protein UgpC [Variovorax boronicumulans]